MFWQKIHKLDQLITLEINSWDSPFTDSIWQFCSNKWVWIPMYAAIIALMIWKLGWKRGLLAVAGALLTFGFCDQFSNIVKDAVERLRPLKDEFMMSHGLHVLERGGGYGFFSAHAANTFGLAVSTYICAKRSTTSVQGRMPSWLKAYGAWMFFWAFMVAVSRIFVGKHYLGDVIVGIIVGSVAGYVFGYLASYIAGRWQRPTASE